MPSLTWNGGTGDWVAPANWTTLSGTDTVPKAVDNASIIATGSYTVTVSDSEAANNLTLNNLAAAVNVTGELTVGGTLLDQSGTVTVPSGTLDGGAITLDGGGIALDGGTLQRTTVMEPNGGANLTSGTLDGVTWQGTLAVVGTLEVEGGLTLEGTGDTTPGTLDLTQGSLSFLDSETLDNANVNYLGLANPSPILFSVAAGQTLTLGPNLVMSSEGVEASTIDGPGAVVNLGTLETPALPGGMLIDAPFTNDGSVNVGYTLEVANDLVNNGTIGPLSVFTALIADQNLSGHGTITIRNLGGLSGILHVDGAIEGHQHIVGTVGGVYNVTAATIDASVTLENFNVGSTINLTGAPYEGAFTTVTYVDGLVTLKDGNKIEDLFNVPGLPNSAVFSTKADNNGATPGTDITTGFAEVACFVSGTRIRTGKGEVAVEDLRVGDMVPVVRAGGMLPIVWIGRRRLRIEGHPRPLDMYPVRVAAGAFADFVPMRDLWLSPEHAVFLHGVLVPVRLLVNGTSIAQMPCTEVTYWHVELASHDLMLCEGAWTESYLDMGNRSAFEEDGAPVQLHPDFSREAWDARACQQQERGGPVVEAIRRAINARVEAYAQAA